MNKQKVVTLDELKKTIYTNAKKLDQIYIDKVLVN